MDGYFQSAIAVLIILAASVIIYAMVIAPMPQYIPVVDIVQEQVNIVAPDENISELPVIAQLEFNLSYVMWFVGLLLTVVVITLSYIFGKSRIHMWWLRRRDPLCFEVVLLKKFLFDTYYNNPRVTTERNKALSSLDRIVEVRKHIIVVDQWKIINILQMIREQFGLLDGLAKHNALQEAALLKSLNAALDVLSATISDNVQTELDRFTALNSLNS